MENSQPFIRWQNGRLRAGCRHGDASVSYVGWRVSSTVNFSSCSILCIDAAMGVKRRSDVMGREATYPGCIRRQVAASPLARRIMIRWNPVMFSPERGMSARMRRPKKTHRSGSARLFDCEKVDGQLEQMAQPLEQMLAKDWTLVKSTFSWENKGR